MEGRARVQTQGHKSSLDALLYRNPHGNIFLLVCRVHAVRERGQLDLGQVVDQQALFRPLPSVRSELSSTAQNSDKETIRVEEGRERGGGRNNKLHERGAGGKRRKER